MTRYVDKLVRTRETVFKNHVSRYTIGPILLGCDEGSSAEVHCDTSWKALQPHKDEDQVERDVNRSFVFYPQGMSPDVL